MYLEMRILLFTLQSCLILLPLVSKISATALWSDEGSYTRHWKSYDRNLRHKNHHQFHRRMSNKDGDNHDCSAELSRDGMSAKELQRSFVAAKFSSLVYDLHGFPEADEEPAYDGLFQGQDVRGSYYESGIDAVYTTRIRNEFCVVAFRGTSGNQDNMREDLESNLNVDPVEFETKEKKAKDDAGCDIHSGFYDAYFGFVYRTGVENFLETCSEECPECDLVLTGHSQGGAIAEVAALSYKQSVAALPENLYVITFGAPQALGVGCLPLFAKEERCRFYRYIMTMEGPLGRGLIYDPVPMILPRALVDFDNDGIIDESSSSDSYARHGGLAFLGHQLFLNDGDSSALALGAFDGHYGVGASKYDVTTYAHDRRLYADVLEGQYQRIILDNKFEEYYECYLPTDGFSLGSLCNVDETELHCVDGISECKRNGWWWGSENTCQAIGDSSTESKAKRRFCHKSPIEWTMVP